MISSEKLLGVVLAGGLSRRMDGPEKSLLNLKGKPLISRVLDRLSPQVANLLVNANGDGSRFGFLDLPVQPDTIDGHVGPLAGVLAGMAWAKQNRPDLSHVLTVAADTPFFPEDYAQQMLAEAHSKQVEIVIAASAGRNHPVFSLWPVSLHDALHTFLADEENRKVMLFVERHRYSLAEFAFETTDPFFNVNTPQDLHRAETILESA